MTEDAFSNSWHLPQAQVLTSVCVWNEIACPSIMIEHEKINYVEFPAADLEATNGFFAKAFAWEFEDFGPDYTAFSDEAVGGGFFRYELKSSPDTGGALIVLYSADLQTTLAKVEDAGGRIVKPIFSCPGGRRFQFTEPRGNELAVGSDKP